MIVFPFETFVSVLRFGTVLRFHHPEFDQKPHFFIITDYTNTAHPPVISLISSKSDINKHYYVTVNANEYKGFDKVSYISCDKIHDFTAETLYHLYSQQKLEILAEMPPEIMNRIVEGCKSSRTISKGLIKRMVLALENALNK